MSMKEQGTHISSSFISDVDQRNTHTKLTVLQYNSQTQTNLSLCDAQTQARVFLQWTLIKEIHKQNSRSFIDSEIKLFSRKNTYIYTQTNLSLSVTRTQGTHARHLSSLSHTHKPTHKFIVHERLIRHISSSYRTLIHQRNTGYMHFQHFANGRLKNSCQFN